MKIVMHTATVRIQWDSHNDVVVVVVENETENENKKSISPSTPKLYTNTVIDWLKLWAISKTCIVTNRTFLAVNRLKKRICAIAKKKSQISDDIRIALGQSSNCIVVICNRYGAYHMRSRVTFPLFLSSLNFVISLFFLSNFSAFHIPIAVARRENWSNIYILEPEVVFAS